MRTSRITLLPLLAALTVAAHADDFSPPSWRLGNTSATVQEWDFLSPGFGLAPDGLTWGNGGGGYVNTNGVPQFLSSTGTYNPAFNGHNGLYDLGGGQNMDFMIPNDGPDPDTKEMWIQITSWNPTGTLILPNVKVNSAAFNGPATLVSAQNTTTNWQQSIWSVSMPWCPASETINILNSSPVNMMIDQVVVDTICNPTPEPMSMLAMGCGIAGLVARRRKKN